MTLHDVSLSDRYDLRKDVVLLGGIQALVRVLLMQRARDEAAGLATGGFVSGYRGSPLGGVDLAMMAASKQLEAADIKFEPGLNEDLAATALWGSQQVAIRGEGRVEGVFGLWYGKGPGVDRCGDVFRHANMAGSAEKGGVLVCMGDDHTGESSTVLHHSEFALVDVMMPILSPAGVQEILDYGLYGWALSRYSGCWVGLKCVKDTIEVSEVVYGDPHRLDIKLPTDFAMPPGGLNIRLHDTPVAQEARLHDYKRFAAEAFARANRLDRRVHGDGKARIGIVSAGKSWLDVAHALELLGLDDAECRRLGIATYKVGMVWPLDMESLREWAHDLEHIIVVEEKRKLIEVQIKEAIFDDRRGRRVTGWKDEKGKVIFSVKQALDPVKVARTLGDLLADDGVETETLVARRAMLAEAVRADNAEEIAVRKPWFCSGCPHNTSTRLPDGARAYAGIGCHYMVQWMDRDTEGFTHMGGEGANWIGEAPFSKRKHIFQNLGDGTYNHSGSLAIRAALAAGVNVTYKILYNDAVAMTGGQPNEGGLDAPRIARELQAMGVRTIIGIYDPKEAVDLNDFTIPMRPRDELDAVQRELENVEGVSAILYIQTCAAEKRRRRKRGKFPDPDRRVFINPDVCEGCGDCGVQSNCVSIVPLETEFGRKRAIDQSSCNKDFSCLKGFCPSFVTLEGAKVRKAAPAEVAIGDLPAPKLPALGRSWNTVITGVGGTGVVTVGAVLAMAAHVDGHGAGVMEMAGLAQKGGAVSIHVRIAPKPSDITAIRVAVGEADALIGGDIVVAAGAKTLGLMTRGRTRGVVNAHEIVTGDFTRNRDFHLPTDRLTLALRARLGEDGLAMLDATRLAEKTLGDAIYANMLMLGAAWQAGLVPVSEEAILRAIELNGAGVDGNKAAFRLGRWAIAEPRAAAAVTAPEAPPPAPDFAALVERRAAHLTNYQNARLARRYRERVEAARAVDPAFGEAVARGYHKLLAYKDEYEVARLHAETLERAVAEGFENVREMRFHMAPPFLSRPGPDGRPAKREFGPWMLKAMKALARFRGLRGTALDPFSRTAERRMERALIAEYEADMDRLAAALTPATRDVAVELAALPLEIRGFGPVKEAAAAAAASRRAALLAEFDSGGRRTVHAA
ncbi:indolepyruvate ferredoxin oxidoreductase family protein [Amaricoccus sp.]|uniref:indolepyruvate ferredoxin oxidoreductase family protein n=1 Tax=Amaricoccus sp. TaxID=1872485 RepID=UPI001B59A985|nr:indolepyruvate ferredoxin oxidoreductase family protein [Amaricoccus sp.]MBP7241878.1 indolepyruvate ferredoxin oxidoreductase family protein [Amaricoccus sp.]